MPKRKKQDYEYIDNFFELIGFIVKKHFSKLLATLLVLSVIVLLSYIVFSTGFKIVKTENGYVIQVVEKKPEQIPIKVDKDER
jgi:hypothetical protein